MPHLSKGDGTEAVAKAWHAGAAMVGGGGVGAAVRCFFASLQICGRT